MTAGAATKGIQSFTIFEGMSVLSPALSSTPSLEVESDLQTNLVPYFFRESLAVSPFIYASTVNLVSMTQRHPPSLGPVVRPRSDNNARATIVSQLQ